MRIVVAGAGNIGRHLAHDLHEREHEVVVIEQDPATLDRAQDDAPGVTFVLGDACEPWVLDKAEVRSSDVIVAATGDDEDNLVIALLSKQEYGVPHVVARVNHPKNEWMFNESWGVDVPMSPPHVLTALVEEAVTVGDLVRLFRLERGQVSLVEITLDEGAPIAGRPLYELRLPPDSAVVAILRRGHVVIPQPETQLVAGDEIMAIATPETEDRLRGALLGDGLAEEQAGDTEPA
ncbi:MAG TPA: TrkA family potassium uptake protein [Actinomycetota bacterium]|nr:TrkA family potassium uptake protein [Actinomycetota bacterium]